jgi:hypothetical protein
MEIQLAHEKLLVVVLSSLATRLKFELRWVPKSSKIPDRRLHAHEKAPVTGLGAAER